MADELIEENKEPVVEEINVPAEPSTEPAAETRPSIEDLVGKGWTEPEIKSAEEKGMVAPVGEKAEKENPKKEEKKEEPKVEEKKAPAAAPLNLDNVTPEQEQVLMDTFGQGTSTRAMYIGMKNNRKKWQAEKQKNGEMAARIAELEAKAAPVAEEETILVDEEGNQIEKPLTREDLKKMQEEDRAIQDKHNQKMGAINQASHEQEAYAKSVLPDFDEVLTRAKEVIENQDTLVKEGYDTTRFQKLMSGLSAAVEGADTIESDGWTAAMIGYEIGKFHPDHGKELKAINENTGEVIKKDPTPKANGSQPTPDKAKLERMQANSQKRASSASVANGGGSRTLAVEDVAISDLQLMKASDRIAFRKNHPAQYEKLLNG